MAGDPEVGQTYEVEIVEETDNQWTGPLGIARMGGVTIPIPKAKVGETHKVKITSVGPNQWTGQVQAEFEKIDGAGGDGPTAPAAEGDPEVGGTYEVTIEDIFDSQWTGPLGIGHIGAVDVRVPRAQVGETVTVKVHSIGENEWTKRPTADVEVIGGEAPAPAPAPAPPAPMPLEWVGMGPLSDLEPGAVKRLVVHDREYALVNLDGEVFALDGLCPHREGPLGGGDLIGGEISCPWHMFRWDVRTGAATMPAPFSAVPTFATRVVGGDIEVQLPIADLEGSQP